MARIRAIDTDKLILNAKLERWILEHSELSGECRLFHLEPGRAHVTAAGRDGEPHGVSVRRAVFALAHPETHVSADEDVINTCGHIGNVNSGEGCCINLAHLRKIDYRNRKEAA